eukprot:GAHX01000936.1.p1 GENE.GAHX01000936.1~~GAHX01000936.1.p1  ORF type:complete len:173 (+),score=41.67 GAHX01000936.1:25-543(+)
METEETEETYSTDYLSLLERGYKLLSIKKSDQALFLNVDIPSPELERSGAKKTSFSNFMEIVEKINRDPVHVMSYFHSELAKECSLDSDNKLIIKGRFLIKHIENVIKKYCDNFVICKDCGSFNTTIVKEKEMRVQKLVCNACSGEKVCASMAHGFVSLARGQRRAARRDQQ